MSEQMLVLLCFCVHVQCLPVYVSMCAREKDIEKRANFK